MNAPVVIGHISWHRVRKGARTIYFPRNDSSDVESPFSEISGIAGILRFMITPKLGGGGAGAEPHALNMKPVSTNSKAT